MKTISVKVYQGGFVECDDEWCNHKYECTNHRSAGDFRSESGLRPYFVNYNKKLSVVDCVSYNLVEEYCGWGECVTDRDLPITPRLEKSTWINQGRMLTICTVGSHKFVAQDVSTKHCLQIDALTQKEMFDWLKKNHYHHLS